MWCDFVVVPVHQGQASVSGIKSIGSACWSGVHNNWLVGGSGHQDGFSQRVMIATPMKPVDAVGEGLVSAHVLVAVRVSLVTQVVPPAPTIPAIRT